MSQTMKTKTRPSDRLSPLYKTETGLPLILKDGQKDILDAILYKQHGRVSILTYTQYGKSMVVGLGILARAVFFNEPWVVIAPTKEKTEIVMRHVIQHLFDHKQFYSQLEVDTPLERLKREKKRDSLTFRRGGRIFCLTAEARNSKKIGQSLLGEGSPNIIVDESPLINDKIFAFIMRMMGGSAKSFLLQIGNAFERNHFQKSFRDPKYHNIIVDCYKGLEESKQLPYYEGVLTEEFLEEQKDQPFFEQLYECKFPTIALTDERGYTVLVIEDLLNSAYGKPRAEEGSPKLGVDVGRGGDKTVFVARWNKFACVVEKNVSADLMHQVARIMHWKERLGITDNGDIFIDDIGVGSGVTDRCKEKDMMVTPVVAGGVAFNQKLFANIKAENYWALKKDLESGLGLEKDEGFNDILDIRYTEDSDKKLKIEPKDEFRKRNNHSPDTIEALMLTYSRKKRAPEITML